MQLNVRVNIDPVLSQVKDLTRQLPYITHKAVDATSKDAQKAIQQSLATHFILRRPEFIQRTIKHLQFSRKGAPTAILGIDPSRDFLAKFEAGGEKFAYQGRLAVPIEARATKQQIIPKAQRPSQLGPKAFTILTKHGKTLLVQRISKAAATKRHKKGIITGPDPRLKILYVLQPSVPIAPRLHFTDIAYATAVKQWPINAKAALALAIRTTR